MNGEITLYLHGFLSRPDSNKGKLLKAEHEKRGLAFIAPELYMSPKEVQTYLLELLKGVDPQKLRVIGSSLGGLYGTWVSENFGAQRSVLLNPAIGNWDTSEIKPGWAEVSGTSKRMWIGPDYLKQVEEMIPNKLTKPSRYMTVISQKDEVLDWRVTEEFTEKTHQIFLPDSDHRISDFQKILQPVMDFVEFGKFGV